MDSTATSDVNIISLRCNVWHFEHIYKSYDALHKTISFQISGLSKLDRYAAVLYVMLPIRDIIVLTVRCSHGSGTIHGILESFLCTVDLVVLCI